MIGTRIMRCGACGTYGGEVRTGFWWEKSEVKRLLGRLRRRWEDNIKMDMKEIGWELWTGLILVSTGTGDRFL
jgi:hypothetical protein